MPEEPMVTLTLPAAQFRTLVEMTYVADWVVCAGEDTPDPGFREAVGAVEQTIFREAVRQGLTDLVDGNEGDEKKSDRFSPTRYLEDHSKVRRALVTYEEERFWDNLISRLSSVFAERQVGRERWRQMTGEERLRALCAHENRLHEAFDKQGMEALFLMSADAAG